ncbi:MAG: hypothetical protein LBP35_02715 [Candidatus Ancillula trichonymphae]|nr:hypothetical protein [Candidatus Ancillula trichonymphae]
MFEIVKNMATEYPLVGEVLDGNIHSQDDTFLNKCEVKEFPQRLCGSQNTTTS